MEVGITSYPGRLVKQSFIRAFRLRSPVEIAYESPKSRLRYGPTRRSLAVSSFRPFTEAHAIAKLDFALLFSDHIRGELQHELQEELQEVLSASGFARLVPRDDDQEISGWERKDEDGDVTEAIHFHAHFAHVVWYDYRGWSNCRDSSIRWLSSVVSRASMGSLNISGIGLECRDVFFFDEAESYRPEGLFKFGTRYLSPIAFQSGPRWRQMISWDDQLKIANRDLRRRNSVECITEPLDRLVDDDSELHVTEISHRQTLGLAHDDAARSDLASDGLRKIWNAAHEANKELIGELLTDDMLRTIGLLESR